MWSVHKRMAELWYRHSNQRALTQEEGEELKMCLDANMHVAQKVAELENYSLIASMTEDVEWQHEICRQIDKLNAKLNNE